MPLTLHALLDSEAGIARLEKELLPAWMTKQRWFAGKQRDGGTFRIVRHSHLGPARVLAVEVSWPPGGTETYAVPLLAHPETANEENPLADAVHHPDFRQALFQLFQGPGGSADFRVEHGDAFSRIMPAAERPPSRVLDVEQSNTSLIFDERLFVKLYRRLSDGINPDGELIRFLSGRGFQNVPPFGGMIDWRGQSFALATACLRLQGNAWEAALAAFGRSRRDPRAAFAWQDRVRRLAEITGQMHLALASDTTNPAFVPERFAPQDADSLARGIASMTKEMTDLLRKKLASLPEQARLLAAQILSQAQPGSRKVRPAGDCLKIRTHGDFHLGQALDTGNDFVITDFEGEPSRPLAERRAKHPPLRDVAGMLRSFHYAAHVARRALPETSIEEAEEWARQNREIFLAAWRETVAGSALASGARDDGLLRLYLKEKAVYETVYELNSRPDWAVIPLLGLAGSDGDLG